MMGDSKFWRSLREEADGASLDRQIPTEPGPELLYEKCSVLSALMINEVSRGVLRLMRVVPPDIRSLMGRMSAFLYSIQQILPDL